jgi:hypothetical protein
MLVEGRLRQALEKLREVAGNRSGQGARCVALQPVLPRDVSVARDAERLEAERRQQPPAVGELQVHGIVRRRCHELRLRRPPPLGKRVECRRRRDDDEPGAGLRGAGRQPQPLERVGERPRANPVHLGAEAQRRPGRVHVRVDEARDDGAAAEIDAARRRPGQLRDVGAAVDARIRPPRTASASCVENAASTVRTLPLTEDRVGLLRPGGAAREREPRSATDRAAAQFTMTQTRMWCPRA